MRSASRSPCYRGGLGLEAEVDAARLRRERSHPQFRSAAACSSGIRDHARDLLARLAARECEQLLDKVNGALDGRAEIGARLATGRFVGRAVEELQLQTHCGQRRAQLVRRIRHECALRLKGRVQPQQQSIERIDQRRHFLRQPLRRDGRQAVRVSPLHFRGETPQRLRARCRPLRRSPRPRAARAAAAVSPHAAPRRARTPRGRAAVARSGSPPRGFAGRRFATTCPLTRTSAYPSAVALMSGSPGREK